MINRWFRIDGVTYNLAAFTHFEAALDRPSHASGNTHRVRGYLMIPGNSETPVRQVWVSIGSFRREDECRSVIEDILTGEYDVKVKIPRIVAYDRQDVVSLGL